MSSVISLQDNGHSPAVVLAGHSHDFIAILFTWQNALTISVEDHRIGIPAEEQKHLFEKFFVTATLKKEKCKWHWIWMRMVMSENHLMCDN